MKVITAPEEYDLEKGEISVFLAGGITNCPEWQDKVIERISNNYSDTDKLVIFNPRRKNFPIDDPLAAEKQIEWEFINLERMDIFSMFFAASDSDQPICMYELGRNIVRMQNKYPVDWKRRIAISSEIGYKRIKDVLVQTELATQNTVGVNIQAKSDDLIIYHVEDIIGAYRRLLY